MTFNDLLTLAKAGYTPAQVKELLTMPSPEEPKQEETKQVEVKEPVIEEKLQEHEDKLQVIEETKKEEPDYKKLYEETQTKLKDAQIQNISQNIQSAEKQNDTDIVTRMISSFL